MPRVLLVDDNDSIRRLVLKMLEREGLEVEQAADGLQAIQKLNESRFDLIILDLMMPRVSGFDVLKEVYDRDPADLQRIIVMTAAAAHVSSELLSGVRTVITKPFQLDHFRAAVRDALQIPPTALT